MAAEVQNSDHDSQLKTAPLRATKMKTQRNQGGDELLKAVLTKRTKKVSTMESTTSTSTESKKTCISTQTLQTQKRGKLSKVPPLKKTTDEKANINESESKSKPREDSNKKMCTCSPTTHEGSFRCHHHRIDANKNSISEKKSTLSCHSLQSPHMAEFKPQLSRFGRAASAELVITHDGLSQPSVVGSS